MINQEDALKRFVTYFNYLDAVKDHYRACYGTLRAYVDACENATRKLQGNSSLDVNYLRKYYRLAWNTEHLLYVSRHDDADVQRLSNHWAPVQAYYAVYCACEATAYALCGQKYGSHSGALNQITDYFKKSQVTPWCWVASGALGKSGKGHRVRNLPPNTSIPNNLQRYDVDPTGMLASSCPEIRYCERWGQQKGLWGTYSVGDGQESVGNSLEMTGLSTLLVAHATRYVDSCRR